MLCSLCISFSWVLSLFNSLILGKLCCIVSACAMYSADSTDWKALDSKWLTKDWHNAAIMQGRALCIVHCWATKCPPRANTCPPCKGNQYKLIGCHLKLMEYTWLWDSSPQSDPIGMCCILCILSKSWWSQLFVPFCHPLLSIWTWAGRIGWERNPQVLTLSLWSSAPSDKPCWMTSGWLFHGEWCYFVWMIKCSQVWYVLYSWLGEHLHRFAWEFQAWVLKITV